MTPLCSTCHGECCVNKRGSVVDHGSALALHSCLDCSDGFAPAPAALVAEVERLRADLDALARAVGQAVVASSLAAGETLADPIPHIIVSTVTRLRAEALGQRAEASYLRACVPPTHPSDYGHEAWAETVRTAVEAERAAVVACLRRADDFSPYDEIAAVIASIESGEHRREETE